MLTCPRRDPSLLGSSQVLTANHVTVSSLGCGHGHDGDTPHLSALSCVHLSKLISRHLFAAVS